MGKMPRPGENIHIPLDEREALRLLMKVKPTAELPRPGTNPTKAQKKRAKKPKEEFIPEPSMGE